MIRHGNARKYVIKKINLRDNYSRISIQTAMGNDMLYLITGSATSYNSGIVTGRYS